MINQFRGATRWLSNFAEVKIDYNGVIYNSTEAAFQAQKTDSGTVRLIFAILSATMAKALGKEVRLGPDWDRVKDQVMYDVNKIKFSQEPFRSQLLATGKEHLEEGNNWGDRYWGTVDGEGQNKLGLILMKIREEL